MDIAAVESLLRKNNISPELIEQFKASAAALPADLLDGNGERAPIMPGLSGFESELLAAYMLEDVARHFGVVAEDGDFWRIAGLPDKDTLLKKLNQRQDANRLPDRVL